MTLFPTPVGVFQIDRAFTANELKFARTLEFVQNEYNKASKETYVLQNERMKSVRKFIEKSVDTFFKEIYQPSREVSLRVTQSWVNMSKKGEQHHQHYHANSFISGVLYLKANKEMDKIYFYSKPLECLRIDTENFNVFNSESWWIPVNTGTLLIFPSYLYHSVRPVEAEERISLSFNTFPYGLVGGEQTLTELKLSKKDK